tara:strand:- start:8283 stop:8687 length:405 start_codon:yes stop_codon:yes gene_type:complete
MIRGALIAVLIVAYIYWVRTKRERMMSVDVYEDCECKRKIRSVRLPTGGKSLRATGITTPYRHESNGTVTIGQAPWRCVKTKGVLGNVEYAGNDDIDNKGVYGDLALDPDGTTLNLGCGVTGNQLFVNWKRMTD